MFRAATTIACAATIALASGCARVPSPLTPNVAGSVGLPHRGVLTGAERMPSSGPGFRFLRDDDRHFATPRFARVLARAASRVDSLRPGATLVLGDLSRKDGGRLLPHLSHRSGRDADLVFYATTVDGAPVVAPDFVHYGRDGLAWDPSKKRFLRLDVEREWLLVKTLLEDPEAEVQWLFVSRDVRALLLEWAVARGEPTETLYRAAESMVQPEPGGVHDDHVHVRVACSREEWERGCERSGPLRPWSTSGPAFEEPPSDEELALSLLVPLTEASPRTTAR
ncbi:MAG: penicillin-insensitive murein endopeptidase [Polyangiaceae bacterium]